MSSTHSRSEIESALSGKQKSPSSLHVDLQLEPQKNNRRQQVIGGNLSGVSHKKNRTGLLSTIRSFNIVNWVAGAIVILIMIAFFWPHESNQSIKEVAEQAQKIPSKSFYTESRVDLEDHKITQTTHFGRDDDIRRASEYRQQDEHEKKIRTLLQVADTYRNNGDYTKPINKNAIFAYHKVLEIDAGNIAAREGIDYINSRFLNSGNIALGSNDKTSAHVFLNKLNGINPQSDASIELAKSIKSWEIKRQIAQFLSEASNAFKQNKLILPASESALLFYQKILSLDENNEQAKNGVKKIADTYIERANSAFIKGQYEAATGYLATVSVIDPEHDSIDLMRSMINNAKPLAQLTLKQPAQTPRSSKETKNTALAMTATNTPTPISAQRTPQRQAGEQAQIDRQYLGRGLAAYYNGKYDTAVSLLQPLADKGISRAQLRIAYMHYLGRGFSVNKKEADRIIRAALPAIQKFSQEGRTWAQSDLGSLYEDGLVLPRDYSEAVYWYRAAAEKGYPGAQTNLGIMYARGRGVTQSRKTAIQWFQRAAKQGDIAAKRNLKSFGVNQ